MTHEPLRCVALLSVHADILTETINYTRQAICSLTKAYILFQVGIHHDTEVHVVRQHQLPLFLSQAGNVTSLG